MRTTLVFNPITIFIISKSFLFSSPVIVLIPLIDLYYKLGETEKFIRQVIDLMDE